MPFVSYYSPGVWNKDIIYHVWLLTRNLGVTNVSFAHYKTPNSKIRAFYSSDKLILMIEYCPTQVSTGDWSSWSNRFYQLNGGDPVMIRTNIGLPAQPNPPSTDPLNLSCSRFVYEANGVLNVSIRGTNYFAQLVAWGPQSSPTTLKTAL